LLGVLEEQISVADRDLWRQWLWAQQAGESPSSTIQRLKIYMVVEGIYGSGFKPSPFMTALSESVGRLTNKRRVRPLMSSKGGVHSLRHASHNNDLYRPAFPCYPQGRLLEIGSIRTYQVPSRVSERRRKVGYFDIAFFFSHFKLAFPLSLEATNQTCAPSIVRLLSVACWTIGLESMS